MTPAAEYSPEALLAHAGWMRALALGLVRDPNEADDVAQDAALATLLHPPPAGAALRPWLAQVVRRLAWRRARSERRRTDREGRSREPAGPEEPGETLARLDLQRVLLDAVRELEEPVRTTLVQRYFEGRTAADIAAASGVPASTVRARLARGLELLRARLDREKGSRGAWMALIAPLAPRELAPAGSSAGAGAVTASNLVQGALTMTLVKIALVTSAAVVSGLALWKLAPERSPELPLAVAPVEAASPSAELRKLPAQAKAVPSDAERSVASVPAPDVAVEVSAPAPVASDQRMGSFDARVVGEQGAPWAGAELSVFLRSSRAPLLGQGTTKSDGRIELEFALPKFGPRADDAAAGNFDLLVRRAGCATRRLEVVVRQDQTTHLGDVVLVEAGTLRGHVVDEAGRALAGVRVGALDAALVEAFDAVELDRFPRLGSDVLEPLMAVETAVDGGFELADVTPGSVVLWAHAEGRHYVLGERLELATGGLVDDLVLVLPELGAGERVAGRVVGPDGKGRPSSLARDMRHGAGRKVDFIETDPQGNFSFPAAHLDSVYELTAHDGYREYASASVAGVRPGDLDVVITLGGGAKLRVRLHDAQGEPVEDAKLRISGTTSLYDATAKAIGPGEFELEMPSERFQVEAEAPGWRTTRSEKIDPGSAPAVLDLVLERAPVAIGHVFAGGRPVPGAKITAHSFDPDGTMTVNGLRCTISPFVASECTADEDGFFELPVDSSWTVVVRASAPGWADAESEPIEPAYVDAVGEIDLELAEPGTIEGHVRVPAGESPGGRIVAVHRGDGRARSVRTGEDGSYRFEGLMPGEWHVVTLEAEIPPHGGAYASYSGSEPMPFNCRVTAGRTTRFDLVVDGE